MVLDDDVKTRPPVVHQGTKSSERVESDQNIAFFGLSAGRIAGWPMRSGFCAPDSTTMRRVCGRPDLRPVLVRLDLKVRRVGLRL